MSRLGLMPFEVCIVKQAGVVSCIGSLGYRDPQADMQNAYVIAVPPAAEIAVGMDHACIRTAVGGDVWCWGMNNKGQLGRSTARDDFEPPARVDGISDAVQISVTDEYSCARQADGSVWCWGRPGGAAELVPDGGAGSPRAIARVANVVDLSVDLYGSCAALADGTVRCWSPGDSSIQTGKTLLGFDSPANLSRIETVSSQTATLALRATDGSVYTSPLTCERRVKGSSYGMPTIGLGPAGWSASSKGKWAIVPKLGESTQVAAAASSGCARMHDGTVRCWGCMNIPGVKPKSFPQTPATVPNVANVLEVEMGLTLTCALRSDDSVICWGVGVGVATENGTPTALAL